MNPSRLSRLLELIAALQTDANRDADALAALCGVHRRTLFRDLKLLRESGLPVEYDDTARAFGLSGPRLLPPTPFTAEEALAVICLCREAGQRQHPPFFGPAQRAALKLASGLPARLRDEVQARSAELAIQFEPQHNRLAGQETVFQQLVTALAGRRAVRIHYDSFFERTVISTKLHSYRLLFSRRSWYVIGRSSLHRQVRTFNVARIQNLEPLADGYSIPPRFSLERMLRNAWHLIPEPGPDQDVVVRFQPKVAGNVAEVAWHKTQRIVKNLDGTIDFHVHVSGLEEISWWILGYGDQAEVLQPPELSAIIAQHARNIVARHDRVRDEPKSERKTGSPRRVRKTRHELARNHRA